MAGGGGLARVHVADDHDVDMDLLLAHGEGRGGLVRRRSTIESNQATEMTKWERLDEIFLCGLGGRGRGEQTLLHAHTRLPKARRKRGEIGETSKVKL